MNAGRRKTTIKIALICLAAVMAAIHMYVYGERWVGPYLWNAWQMAISTMLLMLFFVPTEWVVPARARLRDPGATRPQSRPLPVLAIGFMFGIILAFQLSAGALRLGIRPHGLMRDLAGYVLFVSGPAGAWVLWRKVKRIEELETRHLRGLCVQCGYDLTANVSGLCSECGEPTQPATAPVREKEG